MTRFAPLALQIIQPSWTTRVPSPAHDSLTPEQRQAFLAANPDSYLTVTKSPDDLPPGSPALSSRDLLIEGRRALDRLVEAGAFGREQPARYYGYRLEMNGHQQTGIVGGIYLDDYENGELRVHEQVQTVRTQHLTEHLAVVKAQSSPIAVTHRPHATIAEILTTTVEQSPIARASGADGLDQTVWPIIDQEAEEAITSSFARQPTYIIDGHHRASAGLAYHRATGGKASSLILVAAFSSDQLMNRAFHRRIADLDIDQFESALTNLSSRRLESATGGDDLLETLEDDEVLVYGGGRWLAVCLPHDPAASAVHNLDPARIEHQILRSLLGIEPTNAGARLSYVPGNKPTDRLTADTDRRGGILCMSRPVPVDVLLAAADEGHVMPPKSTYFEPKVRSGVFVRSTVD